MARVLFVEGDVVAGRSTARLLMRFGHDVRLCARGRTALDLLAAEQFDVVLLDWVTPGIDGPSLIQALRASRSSVPVIIVSAKTSRADRVFALRTGADAYVCKPCTAD